MNENKNDGIYNFWGKKSEFAFQFCKLYIFCFIACDPSRWIAEDANSDLYIQLCYKPRLHKVLIGPTHKQKKRGQQGTSSVTTLHLIQWWLNEFC